MSINWLAMRSSLDLITFINKKVNMQEFMNKSYIY
jgi:hypothetical protein